MTDDDDTIPGTAWGDTLSGLGGNDLIYGYDGDDSLVGGNGADTLVGGSGADTLNGGEGSDTASYASAADTIAGVGVAASLFEGGFGGNALGDIYLGIENLTGSVLADTLIGSGAANLLVGLTGNDVMSGLNGDDTLSGDDGADSLSGGHGDDLMIGGLGADTMRGGTGSDVYEVDSASDRIIETRDAGHDRVRSTVNLTLAGHVEELELQGIATIGTGNTLDNLILGNALANVLTGGAGADTLVGGLGNDTLRGGNGDDWLVGGAGNDRLEGSYGWDTVVSPFALDEIVLQRLSAGVIRLTDPTGLDTLYAIEGLELAGTLWKVAPTVIPIGPSTPWNLRVSRLDGPAGSSFGSAVGGAGDVDGDGRPDIVAGSSSFSGGDGASWLLFGRQSAAGANFVLGDGSVRFLGESGVGAGAGSWVGGLGDIDGDGYDDLGVGLPLLPFLEQTGFASQPTDGGVSFVRGRNRSDFGAADGSTRFLTDGTSNTVAFGETATGDVGGTNVAAGDLNGDGLADVAIGGTASSGYISILLGGETRLKQIGLADGSVTRLSTTLIGINQGTALGGGGDVNGDGFDDLVIGAPGVGNTGRAWVMFGKGSGWGGTQTLGSGTGFVTMDGAGLGDSFGSSATVVGDMNGDGLDDFAVGAPNADVGSGNVYIVLGRSTAFPATLPLTSANGVFRFEGVDAFDGAGRRLSRAGDVNGDGYADLLVGGAFGEAWLILGRPTFAASQLLSGTGVIEFEGTDSFFARSISGVGDVDGDGLDDLLVGQASVNSFAGAAWVIHGERWLGI